MNIRPAIRAALIADADLLAAIGGAAGSARIYAGGAEDSAQRPYIVLTVADTRKTAHPEGTDTQWRACLCELACVGATQQDASELADLAASALMDYDGGDFSGVELQNEYDAPNLDDSPLFAVVQVYSIAFRG